MRITERSLVLILLTFVASSLSGSLGLAEDKQPLIEAVEATQNSIRELELSLKEQLSALEISLRQRRDCIRASAESLGKQQSLEVALGDLRKSVTASERRCDRNALQITPYVECRTDNLQLHYEAAAKALELITKHTDAMYKSINQIVACLGAHR
jgi:hypothetical protein